MHSLRRADVVSCPSATHFGRSILAACTVASVTFALPFAVPAFGADVAIQWSPNASFPSGKGSHELSLQRTWLRGVAQASGHLRLDGFALTLSQPTLIGGSGVAPLNNLTMAFLTTTSSSMNEQWVLPPETPDLSEPPIVMASGGGGSGSNFLTSNPGTPSIKPFQLPDTLDAWDIIDNSEDDPPIVVPIPATAILSGIGLIGVVAIRRRIMARVGT